MGSPLSTLSPLRGYMEKRKELIPYFKPDIQLEDTEAVTEQLLSGWIGLGKKTEEFEQEFAKYKGVKNAVATNSCTSALMLALKTDQQTHGFNSRQRVLVPALTWVSTAMAAKLVGYDVVLGDVSRETYLLSEYRQDIDTILTVNLFGFPDLRNSGRISKIVDAAHSIESEVDQKAFATCYSFYASKNITTIEGGMVVTNDNDSADKMRQLRYLGIRSDGGAYNRFIQEGVNKDSYHPYVSNIEGYKCYMPDVNAAMGLSQLKRIEKNWARRNHIWWKYNQAFKDLPFLIIPPEPVVGKHSRHIYPILFYWRERLKVQLREYMIQTSIHYVPLYYHPSIKDIFRTDECKFNTEWIYNRELSLPLYPNLTDEEVDYIIYAVKECVERICEEFKETNPIMEAVNV
mgnify:CR=1 FL=1